MITNSKVSWTFFNQNIGSLLWGFGSLGGERGSLRLLNLDLLGFWRLKKRKILWELYWSLIYVLSSQDINSICLKLCVHQSKHHNLHNINEKSWLEQLDLIIFQFFKVKYKLITFWNKVQTSHTGKSNHPGNQPSNQYY